MSFNPLHVSCLPDFLMTDTRSTGERRRQWLQKRLQPLLLLVFLIIISLGPTTFSQSQPAAYAAVAERGLSCAWYTVRPGDTLGRLAQRFHTNIWTLVRTNHIWNINLIFIGQRLCISSHGGSRGSFSSSGVLPNGSVRWYAYDALEWSNQAQVSALLRRAAALYGLPPGLLLAIAWQESGWYQHVVSRDGGIGAMQVMPETAALINRVSGYYRDPYKLWDNLTMGATYVRWLWNSFNGNIIQVISAYNEGPYAVRHWGIYNWRYVNNVLYLSRRFMF